MMLHGVAQLTANGSRALLLKADIAWRVFVGYAVGALVVLALFVAMRFVVGKLIAMGLTPFFALAVPARLQLDVQRPWHPLACGAACTALSLTPALRAPYWTSSSPAR